MKREIADAERERTRRPVSGIKREEISLIEVAAIPVPSLVTSPFMSIA